MIAIIGGFVIHDFFVQVGYTPVKHKYSRSQNSSVKIDLNTATATQLASINGIGPKTARKIIRYRKIKNFKNLSEITRVKGIGQKKAEKIKKFIFIDN